jgi:hypothetical protein
VIDLDRDHDDSKVSIMSRGLAIQPAPAAAISDAEAELLIREARARHRRRQLRWVLMLAVLIAASGILVAYFATPPSRQTTAKPAVTQRLLPALLQRPHFVVYVAGSNVLGPGYSQTVIEGSDADAAKPVTEVLVTGPPGLAVTEPSLNAVRTRIVYVESPPGQIGADAGQGNLVIARADGTDSRQVTTEAVDSDPV